MATTSPYLSDAEIAILNADITGPEMRDHIARYSSLPSRHVLHSGNEQAVLMLEADLARVGAELTVTTKPFPVGGKTRHNVQAVLPRSGGARGIVLVTAHLDSTTNETSYEPRIDPAPGADDDASGVAGVLLAARAILRLAALAPGADRKEIRFVLFNAEEVGRAGSRAYAAAARAARDPIVGVYHMDMIGFACRGPQSFELHAGYAEAGYVEDASLKLAEIARGVAGSVASALSAQVYPSPRGSKDPAEGFTDHTSFHEELYPACALSEDHFDGPAGAGHGHPNPGRHRKTDTIDLIDPEYAAAIARTAAGAAWYWATH